MTQKFPPALAVVLSFHGIVERIEHPEIQVKGHARNLAVAASGDAVIAVGGGFGTLTEIAFARILRRPVVVLEPGWDVAQDGVVRAATPGEAVKLALRLASEGEAGAGTH